MSTYKINVNDLSKIVANGYKDILESTIRTAINEHIQPIVDDAIKALVKQIDAGVNSYYHTDMNNIVVELYVDKSKVDWK